MTSQSPLEIVLIDAERTRRKGTELLLRSWGHHVIGSAGDVESGVSLIRKRHPHVAIIDKDLPQSGGAELVRRVLSENPSAQLVVQLGPPSKVELEDALRCGARGVVLTSGGPEELFSAIAVVGKGGRYVAPSVEHLVAHWCSPKGGLISKREREVLHLLASGATGQEISSLLTLSPETVRTHVRNAMRKLGARTRVHAVMMATRQQEIPS